MVHVFKWPTTDPRTSVVEPGASYIAPLDPMKSFVGDYWIVDFNNPKTYKLIDSLRSRSRIV
jgi:hypothetical protein